MDTIIILWLKNDLRLFDNHFFDFAKKFISKKKTILPIFSFDPRFFGKNATQTTKRIDTQRTGILRTKFLIESVLDLRKSLRSIGSDLLVTNQEFELFLLKLLDEHQHLWQQTILVYQ